MFIARMPSSATPRRTSTEAIRSEGGTGPALPSGSKVRGAGRAPAWATRCASVDMDTPRTVPRSGGGHGPGRRRAPHGLELPVGEAAPEPLRRAEPEVFEPDRAVEELGRPDRQNDQVQAGPVD